MNCRAQTDARGEIPGGMRNYSGGFVIFAAHRPDIQLAYRAGKVKMPP